MTSVGIDPSKDAAYPPPPPAYTAGSYGGQPGGSNWAVTGGAGTMVVMTSQPGIPVQGGLYRYGQVPAAIVCQHCNATVTTSTMYTVGSSTWVICLIVCIIGLWLGCCLIPFCLNSCKDVVHICPNCRATVGRYSRL